MSTERKSIGLAPERHARLRTFKHSRYAESFDSAVGLLLDEAGVPEPEPELIAESRVGASQGD